MPLTKDETLAIARIMVRAQNLLKGESLDQARACLSNDRQYEQFKKIVKGKEAALRQGLMDALVAAGLTKTPLTTEEMARLK